MCVLLRASHGFVSENELFQFFGGFSGAHSTKGLETSHITGALSRCTFRCMGWSLAPYRRALILVFVFASLAKTCFSFGVLWGGHIPIYVSGLLV